MALQQQSHTRWRATGSCLGRARPRPLRSVRAAAQPESADVVAAQNAQEFSAPAAVAEFLEPIPPEVEQRLADVASMLPGLGPDSRVLDVGAGTGCLIPHLQRRGVADVLAVDISEPMLQQLAARFPAPSTCGNESGVRTWAGDFMSLPAYLGPFTGVTMNAVFGNLASPRDALLHAALLLAPGGHVLISHPLGRAWHTQLHRERPDIVPHQLPDEAQLAALTADLPLQLAAYRDEPELYAALLQVPPGYRFPRAPLLLRSRVVHGFGRGSRQLGVPTANLDPGPLAELLAPLPQGVYFGWAQLTPPPGWAAADARVHKMVLNVGRRPTVNTGDEAATVEAHILHSFSGDEFYGCELTVLACGFLRPEVRFAGLPQLLRRIRTDIGIAKTQLDEPEAAALRLHEAFRQP